PANEVEIAIDPDRLNAHGVALNTLAQRLRTVNFSVSAGMLEDGGMRFRVQPQGEIGSLDELRGLVINPSGLRLGDIAEVRLKPERIDYARRLDGRKAVGIEVFKERDANLVEVSRAVMAEMNAAGADPGLEGIEFKVIQDMGKEVTGSLLELA